MTLRGDRTAVRRWGSGGPTVVVAHSAGLDGHSAQWFGEALAGLGAQLVSIDLRGHGSSTSGPARVTLDEIARDLAELPAALGLERPHLVGTSLGGAVGSLAVCFAPRAYESLTIVCAPDRGYQAFADRAARADSVGMPGIVDETLDRWFTQQQLDNAEASVELARTSVAGMQLTHWTALWRDFARFDGHPDLRGIVPVHCIAGELDQSTPPEVMSRVAETVGADLQVIGDAPHQALMTHSAEIAQLWASRNL